MLAICGLLLLVLLAYVAGLLDRGAGDASAVGSGSTDVTDTPVLAAAPDRTGEGADSSGAASADAVPEQTELQRPSHSDDSSLWNDEALAALEVGDFDRAIELLLRAREARPEEDAFAHNLTEAYVRRGLAFPDTEALAAVADFESALEHVLTDERRTAIEAMRDRARSIATAEENFVVESTLHFTFRFDAAKPELFDGIDALKRTLEETYQEYGDLFGERPVENGAPRIEVVFYDRADFLEVTNLNDWAGGAFDGSIRVPVTELASAASVARLTQVLRHETAHAFTVAIGGADVPAWLSEGIAQWLENPGRRAFDLRMARGRLAASGAQLFPLEQLGGTISGWTGDAKIRRAYDQALGFTAYIHATYGGDLIYNMIRACKAGGTVGAAQHFQNVILVDLDTVSGDFRDDLLRDH